MRFMHITIYTEPLHLRQPLTLIVDANALCIEIYRATPMLSLGVNGPLNVRKIFYTYSKFHLKYIETVSYKHCGSKVLLIRSFSAQYVALKT